MFINNNLFIKDHSREKKKKSNAYLPTFNLFFPRSQTCLEPEKLFNKMRLVYIWYLFDFIYWIRFLAQNIFIWLGEIGRLTAMAMHTQFPLNRLTSKICTENRRFKWFEMFHTCIYIFMTHSEDLIWFVNDA